jgi:hypothetical protein
VVVDELSPVCPACADESCDPHGVAT